MIISKDLQKAIKEAKELPLPNNFLWGAASAAYQVEGFTNVDKRGETIWDYYLDELKLGVNQDTGKEAIHFYDRHQYLKDIEIFKKIGLNSYRFSVCWTRIIPNGIGEINMVGIRHYRRFIKDLKSAGIRPLLTIYHWDMPKKLYLDGGWKNRKAVDWFKFYSEIIFKHFHDLVEDFILINEPTVEFGQHILAKKRQEGQDCSIPMILPSFEYLADSLKTYNHILLACAAAKEVFSAKHYKGRLGLAFPYFPVLSPKDSNASDRLNAQYADGILNRWFLDAMFKGKYPSDIIELVEKYQLDTGISVDDAKTIGNAKFEFLGINYYAPLYVRKKEGEINDYAPIMQLSDGEKEIAFNGVVRPEQLYKLLFRIKEEWGNPTVIITENGAGFPNAEDELIDGKVNDEKRSLYIANHISAMKKAISEGANVEGYHVWSSHDNLEWLSGYGSRFGMIYVDFQSQERIPKLSTEVYHEIIEKSSIPSS